MAKVNAGKLSEVMGGTIIRGDAALPVKGIMTRCTKVLPGQLYFDVKGGPGGDMNILEAIKRGARSIVISRHKRKLPFEDPGIVVISVPRVWEAFWEVVKFYRNMFDIPVVGVTGTSGKSTTKEMVASIFRHRWRVLKTIGNMNLPDCVPDHIMRLPWGYNAAVFEIGMNRPGHISRQSRVIRPGVGIITHIGTGHVEHLGSYENVIKEKAGIIEGIPAGGYLILNADDHGTGQIDLSGFSGRVIYYGLNNKADYKARDIEITERGTWFTAQIDNQAQRFYIPIMGRHNVYNALAAIAAARVYGFDYDEIRRGLARYRRPHMRLQVMRGIRNSLVINDTYNANKDSMIAGLEVLSAVAGGRTTVAVLGNMLEQGDYARENHSAVGRKAAELRINWLVTVGRLAKHIAAKASTDSKEMKVWSFLLKQQAVQFLKQNLPDNSVVLVKGSRGAYMERMARALREPERVKEKIENSKQPK